jgi:hypothetical protein
MRALSEILGGVHGAGFPNKGGHPMSHGMRFDNPVPMFSDRGANAADAGKLELFWGSCFALGWAELLTTCDLPGLLHFNRRLRSWWVKTYGEDELTAEFDRQIARLTERVERKAS